MHLDVHSLDHNRSLIINDLIPFFSLRVHHTSYSSSASSCFIVVPVIGPITHDTSFRKDEKIKFVYNEEDFVNTKKVFVYERGIIWKLS